MRTSHLSKIIFISDYIVLKLKKFLRELMLNTRSTKQKQLCTEDASVRQIYVY